MADHRVNSVVGLGAAVGDGGVHAVGHIGAVLNGVRHQAVVDAVGHHSVDSVVGSGSTVSDGVVHTSDHIVAVLDGVRHQAVADDVAHHSVNSVVGDGRTISDGGVHTVGHVAAVLDLVRSEVVLNHGIDSVVDVRRVVADGRLHAVVHVFAVLNLIGSEVVLNHRVDGDVGGGGGVLDGIVHAAHHCATVHIGAEGERNSIHGVACVNGIATPGDGGVDNGVSPVDGGEVASVSRGGITNNKVQQTVDVSVDTRVGFGVDRGTRHLNVNGDIHGFVARQMVVAAADHCLVIQFCGRLCHGSSQAHH